MVIILTENIKELYSDLYESQGKSDYMNLLSKIEMHQEKLLHPIEEKVNEQTPKRKVIVVPPINLDKLALIKSKT